MALNVQTLRTQLKSIDFCQPMNENSIVNDLTDVLAAIQFCVNAESLDDQFFSDKEKFVQPPNKLFFLYELPLLASKYVIEFKQFTNITNEKNGKQILMSTVELCLKTFTQYPDNVKALEALKLIFDPDRQYFRFHSQIEQDDTRYTQNLDLSAEQILFCQSLNVGDKVDCLKYDLRSNMIDWSRGTISKVSDRHVWVKWLGDEESAIRKVFRNSWDLAAYKSQVPDSEWDWRFTLEVGDLVDCPDDNVWYNSSVVEKRQLSVSDGTPVIEYKIGFRFYDINGPLLDMRNNQKYFGWSTQYDEDILASNPRIQKLNKFSKKFCKYASMSYAEESLKDAGDHVYQIKRQEKVFAVPRFNSRNSRRSQVMVDLVQYFGKLGGFTLIQDRLSNPNQWCPIDATHLMISSIGNIQEYLNRTFCYEYIPNLWDLVSNNLFNSPDSNLRNFSSLRVTETLQGLGNLLKRVYSLKEKTELIDKLEMNIALKCFNSDFLERKIQGLKAIQDLIKKMKDYQMTMQNSDIKFLTTQVMAEWINENKIFEQLYVQNTNAHLIQRSSDFLKFMLDEHFVTLAHMEMVWASVNRNETEQKLAVYKLLKDVSSSLLKEHLDFLVDRICEKDGLTLTKDDVDLLGDLTRYNYRYREEFCQKFCEFFWKILSNSAKLTTVSADHIIQYYIDQVNSFEMRPHRQAQLKIIAASITTQVTSTRVAYKVLVKFVEKLEIQPLSWDSFTRNVALTELENEFQLIQGVTSGLENIKKAFVAEQISQTIYLDEVKSRMNFIQFFYSNITTNELRLSFTVIATLWEQLVCKSACNEERDLLYQWFSSLASQGQTLTSIVALDDLKSFFDTKMVADQQQLSQLTPEGFNCLKAVLQSLNIHLGNFRQSEKKTDYYASTSYNSNSYYYPPPTYGPQLPQSGTGVKQEYQQQKQFEFKVHIDPQFIYGFKPIWDLIINVQDVEVSKLANEFLQDLYRNLDEGVQEPQTILGFLFDELKRLQGEPKKLVRVLLVLGDTIDESEVDGPGNVKSLNALRSSEQVTIPIVNDHSTGTPIMKKFNITIFENQSIIELRHAISKQLRVPWDTVGLSSTQGEVKFTDNGKMIKDLRLKKGECLITNKKATTKELPEKELLDAENNLTDAVKVVFAEAFTEHSTNEKMNKEQCARFVTGCTGNPCSQDDQQISRTFEQYDKDKDGLLTLSDFYEFYTEAARSKKSTVWQNLHTLNYRNDLLRGDRVPLPTVQTINLPRGKITNSTEWMQQLFNLLDSTDVQLQEKAWYLLRRLPPSPSYFKKIVTFDGIKTPEDWDSVVSINSNFRLLYSLHIIEFLMSNQSENESSFLALLEQEVDETNNQLELKSQESILNLKDRWMSEFLSLGGFDRLFLFFKNYQGKSVSQLDIYQKEILSFLLNTFSQYLVAACAIKLEGAYRTKQLTSTILMGPTLVLQALRGLGEVKIEEPTEFKALVQRLKDGLGDSIIQKFELPSFTQVLRSLIDELLSSTRDLESEDRALIEYAIITIVVVLLYDQRLASVCMGDEDFLRMLFDGLYTEKSANIRNLFARAILIFCHQSQVVNGQGQPTKVLLERLIVQLKDNTSQEVEDNTKVVRSTSSSTQYYELLCSLIDVTCENDQTNFIEFEEFSLAVMKAFLDHNSCETRAKSTPIDSVLVGLLNLLEKLLSVKPNLRDFLKKQHKIDLVQLIFNECLFSLGQPVREVKCKSTESRQVVFKLLLTLSRDNSESTATLLTSLSALASRLPIITKWNHIPAQDMRSQNGFVGLRNPGCICYMNAMLQQFYMTPTFRYGILMSDDEQDVRLEKRADGAIIDDNVLHQIQQMFGYLELSDRVDYNPHEFCFSFKDFSGQPVNILIQQDAQEFLNMIFDKLETSLKPTPFKYIMDGVYGGKTCTQLVCSKCKNVRTKEEQFYNLSLTIKNLKHLNECFEKYIQGEEISDFKCEACEQKVDVTKRQLLSHLPNVLILHLQRIVFNLDTLMNEKINTRLEFPMDLDLKDFTVKGQEKKQNEPKEEDNPPKSVKQLQQEAEEVQQDECTEYHLAGVVVHYGTAEFGHYFSYIDIKRQQKEFLTTPEQWLEFNDSKIKEFKTKQIEGESFGGTTSESTQEDEMWGGNRYGRENSQNAYILVYEKKQKQPLQLIFENEQQLADAQVKYSLPQNMDVQKLNEKIVANLGYYDLKPFIGEKLKDKVSQDNQQFLLERNLFDPELQQFLMNTISLVGVKEQDVEQPLQIQDESTQKALISVLMKFSFDLLARAQDNKQLEPFVNKLKLLLTTSPQHSFDFLNEFFFSRVLKTIDLILVCPETKTRTITAKLLATAFNLVIQYHKLSLEIDDEVQISDDLFDNAKQDSPQEILNLKIIKGLKTIYVLIQEQVPKNWLRLEAYFAFWVEFMRGGDAQIKFMMKNQFITYLIDFILEKQSPLNLYEKKHSMGNQYYSINYENLFIIINELVNQQLITGQGFSKTDKKLLYNFRFYDKVLRNINSQSSVQALSALAVTFAKNNMYYSEIICGCLLRGINRADQDEIGTYLAVLANLVKINDQFKQLRIEWLLGVPQLQNHSNKQAKSEIYHFGTYGMTSLDEDFLHFPSPLGWQSTLLDYIVTNKTNKSSDNQCLLTIKCLLKLLNEDPEVFNFVLKIPSSNYLFKYYDEVLVWFLSTYMLDSKRYFYHNFPRDNEADETKKLLDSYQEKLTQFQRNSSDYIIGKSVQLIIKKKFLYAIDSRTQEKVILEESSPEGKLNWKKVQSDPLMEKICYLEDRIYRTYICDNVPTGQTNEGLPPLYVKGSQIFTYSVVAKTMPANFIQSKQWNQNTYYEIEDENEKQKDEELETEQFDQSQATDQQLIKNPRFLESARQISVHSLLFKPIQAVVRIIDEDGQAPHFIPLSPIQSMIQPNSTAFMFTTKKNRSDQSFNDLTFDLTFKPMDVDKDSHLYLSTPEQMDLDKAHNI